MKITSLDITNYKNYSNQKFNFNQDLIAILGNNGMGKTNILDAIYYACIGKSYFTSSDRNVVKHHQEFFRIQSNFKKEESNKVVIKVKPGNLKKIQVDGNELGKISDHIGTFPIVIVAPVDIQLLLDGSEERRTFMNNSIIQFSKDYLQQLLLYNRLLKQRNALLKMFLEKRYFDPTLLDSITSKMVEPSRIIHDYRSKLIDKISPLFESGYNFISGGQEICKIRYKSQLNDLNSEDLFLKNIEKDRILGRTTSGIHKDDLEFEMGGEKLKTFASQGQLKTYILALKLAQFELLSNELGILPIILFDDIFDKLDGDRVTFLLKLINSEKYGQVIITDTSLTRIPNILEEMDKPYQSYIIKSGEIVNQYEKE